MCFQESRFNDLRNSSALLGTLSGVDTSCVINKLSKQGVRPCSKQHTPSSHRQPVLPQLLGQQHPRTSLGQVPKAGQVPLQLPAQPVQLLPRDCRLPGHTQEIWASRATSPGSAPLPVTAVPATKRDTNEQWRKLLTAHSAPPSGAAVGAGHTTPSRQTPRHLSSVLWELSAQELSRSLFPVLWTTSCRPSWWLGDEEKVLFLNP